MTISRTLNREKVVKAATEIAHNQGLPALTMSSLARKLNIRTQSLYHYVSNWEELIALVGAYVLKTMRHHIVEKVVGLSGKQALVVASECVRLDIKQETFMSNVFYIIQKAPKEHEVHDELDKFMLVIQRIIDADPQLKDTLDAEMFVGSVFGLLIVESLPESNFIERRSEEERRSLFHKMVLRFISPSPEELNAK
ncbi:TetR/AcrR family transcriptional regulator [Limosilactobacillus sp.]|uniref:TetR/AcrR family transcriptional regulator n=1 Tax=Limosilactobacillus sp. TaxID=2773925 RepID=UPI00345E7103